MRIFAIVVVLMFVMTPLGVFQNEDSSTTIDTPVGDFQRATSYDYIDDEIAEWLRFDDLHNLGYDASGIDIAIIDSGLHPHSYFTTTLDTDLTYFSVDNDGIQQATEWTDPLVGDSHYRGHGTKVTGVALQFAPDADLVFYSLNSAYGINWTRVDLALEHLNDNYATLDVEVLSMSFGDNDVPIENPALAASIEDSLESLVTEGVTIFISAGNDGDSTVNWPARIAPDYYGIVSVGAVYDSTHTSPGLRWYVGPYDGSDYGDDLEVMATGVDVNTTNKYGGYGESTGTSFATPIAAATAACLIDRWRQDFTIEGAPKYIEEALRSRSKYIYTDASLDSPEDFLFGYGNGVVQPYDTISVEYDTVDSKTATKGTVTNWANLNGDWYMDTEGTFTEAYTSETTYSWDLDSLESFSGSFPPSGWSTDDWSKVSSGGLPGAYARLIRSDASSDELISKTYNTYGDYSVHLDFKCKTGVGFGYLKVYVKNKYGNWDLVMTLNRQRSWRTKSWSSTSHIYKYGSFQVKYYAYGMVDDREWVGIDEHRVRTKTSSTNWGYRFDHEFTFSSTSTSGTVYLEFFQAHRSNSENLVIQCWYDNNWVNLGTTDDKPMKRMSVTSFVSSTFKVRIYSESLDATSTYWDIGSLRLSYDSLIT